MPLAATRTQSGFGRYQTSWSKACGAFVMLRHGKTASVEVADRQAFFLWEMKDPTNCPVAHREGKPLA